MLVIVAAVAGVEAVAGAVAVAEAVAVVVAAEGEAGEAATEHLQ